MDAVLSDGGFHKCAVCLLLFPEYKQLEVHYKTHFKTEQPSAEEEEEGDVDNYSYSPEQPGFNSKIPSASGSAQVSKTTGNGNIEKHLNHKCLKCEERFETLKELQHHHKMHIESENKICYVDQNPQNDKPLIVAYHSEKYYMKPDSDSYFQINSQPCPTKETEEMDAKEWAKRQLDAYLYTGTAMSNAVKVDTSIGNLKLPLQNVNNSVDKSKGENHTMDNDEPEDDVDQAVEEDAKPRKPTYSELIEGLTGTTCPLCGKSFSLPSILRKHMKIHTDEKPYICGVCTKAFRSNSHLKRHMRMHTGEKPYPCDMCEKSFTQIIHLNTHKAAVHTEEKPFKCGMCQKSFSTSSLVKLHIGLHTGETPYKCDYCDQVFMSRESVESHQRTHTGEKPFKCEDCNKSFRMASHLKKHIKYHTEKKAHQCEICSKSFISYKYLQIHIKYHTGDKPFKCSYCGKGFCTNSDLQKHIKIHTGDKPFPCVLCNKTFISRGHLTKHWRTHTGEKPFDCSVCQKSFRRNDHLQTHMMIHTGEKPYKCDLCGKAFRASSDVQRHIKTHLKKQLSNPEVSTVMA